MSKDSELFCSQCKFSRYVMLRGQKKLFCHQRVAFGLSPYIPTDCTNAETCLEYQQERWRENLTTRTDYVHKMQKCGIPLFLEKQGRLARIQLD